MQGKVIIAKPFLSDGYFKRSVVFIVEHNEEGTIGFVINRRLDLDVSEVLRGVDKTNLQLFAGGPVSTDQLFFVHKHPDVIEDSLEIGGGFYWGGNFEQALSIVFSEKKHTLRFFIGYTGWSPNQLQDEIDGETWLITEPNFSKLFEENPDNSWGAELKRLGNKYASLDNFPDEPSLN